MKRKARLDIKKKEKFLGEIVSEEIVPWVNSF